jgi:hypothetical protein
MRRAGRLVREWERCLEGHYQLGGAHGTDALRDALARGDRQGNPLIRFSRTALFFAFSACSPDDSGADEGGSSFWLPGAFGSLAAVPQQPGCSLSTTYYHTQVFRDRRQPERRRLSVFA